MPTIEVCTEHHLPAAEAAERLRAFGETLKQKHGDEVDIKQERWEDQTLEFSLAAKGITIRGQLVVTDHKAAVRCNLPFAAMLFRGRIEKDVENALRDALSANG